MTAAGAGEGSRPWWESRAFLLALVLLSIAPLIVPAVPPLVDLPGHMGRYRIALGGSALLDRYYTFHWLLSGNVGGDLIMVPLSGLLGVGAAAKLVALAIPAAIVGLAWGLAREVHGRVPPTFALVVPLIYTQPFLFGFVNYMLGVVAALATLWLFIRLGRLGRFRLRAMLMVPLGIAVFLLHASAWGLLGLMAFAAEWTRRRGEGAARPRALVDTIVQLLPLAAPLLLLALWQSSAAGTTRTSYQPWIKLAWLTFIFRDRWVQPDVAMSLLFGGALLMLWRTREIRWNATFGLAALLILVAYCAVPFMVFGSAYADTRLLPVMFIALVLAMAPPGGEHHRLAGFVAIGCVAVAVARIGLVGASFLVAAREQAAVLPAIDRIERGARVATAVGDQCASWALHRGDHLGSLAIVRREAFSNDQWFLPGSVAVEIHYPEAGEYAHDPVQLLDKGGCAPGQLERWMRELPAAAFDNVWLIGTPPMPAEQLGRWRPVYVAPGSALYRRIDVATAGSAPSPASTIAPAAAAPAG